MEKRFVQEQKGLTDSVSFYRLELFRAFCRFLQGDTRDAMRTNDRVLAYARSHDDTDALEAVCWNHRYAMLQE